MMIAAVLTAVLLVVVLAAAYNKIYRSNDDIQERYWLSKEKKEGSNNVEN